MFVRVTSVPRPRLCVAAVACVLAVTALPTSARADTTQDEIERTRAAVADIAQRWFDSTAEAQRLDTEIAAAEEQIADARAEAERARELAQAQAVELYTGSSTALAGVLDADDALDTARRAELFARADDEARRAIDTLEAAASDLEARRADLEDRRARQAELSQQLADQQAALDAQLDSLQQQAAREAEARAQAEARAAARNRPNPAPTARVPIPAPGATPTTPITAPEPVAAPVRNDVHPRHDEPFLVCTRERESNGSYTAVNPAGYYGAYQFAPTTWDVTASRAGRLELIGVLPSRASEYDQDDLAWVLYQWQGNQPWNGRC